MRAWMVLALLLWPAAPPLPAQEPVPILPLKEVRPGLKGHGLTVFTTPRVERFQFEVLGVERNFFPQKDVIWVMLTDEKLRHSGVVGGMSGSPLYVDGRLMGALAYGYTFQKDPIAGITPIEQMLEIPVAAEKVGPAPEGMAAPGGGPSRRPAGPCLVEPLLPEDPGGGAPPWIEGLMRLLEGAPGRLPIDPAEGPRMLGTPLVLSGFDRRVLAHHAPLFEAAGLVPVSGGSGGRTGERLDYPWEPGSPVAGLLMDGDLLSAATGTMSYRVGDHILAFGHPFLSAGPLEMPMCRAEVLFTMTTVVRSFKMSNAVPPEGTIRFDHQNGILGVIGPVPRMIPVTTTLRLHGEERNSYRYRVFNHKDWSGSMISMGVSQAASGIGPESAELALAVEAEIVLKGRPPLRLRNLHTGSFAPFQAAGQVASAMRQLQGNPFEPAEVEGVRVVLDATLGLKTAQIAGVAYDRGEVEPGEEVGVTVRLRPHRGPITLHRVVVPIPEDLPDGTVQIVVGGAAQVSADERRLQPFRFQAHDLDQVIRILSEARPQDRVYVRATLRQAGAVVQGEELPELPPSVLTVLTTPRARGVVFPAADRLLGEYSVPAGAVVTGLDRHQLQVRRRP